ncbi:beta-galactosidase [Granulicella sp. S156]|uniref:beta-galactosidase n=1 Tax=Granulicella sp. S156 TaxID=1747224 RepID=UPI00131E325D|nr:beta-galactosidase [Granulicella sp. S156]
MRKIWMRTVVIAGLAVVVGIQARAQNLISIDATAPMVAPQPVAAKLGASRNPRGQVIGVNSQYLTLDGKPWLPVMGEFQYSRYPEEEWEQEILKMKAAGVQVIEMYIIWNHHEEVEGQFDWTGRRDLRKFVELCAKHGMDVYPRIGPWAHGEVRHGGFPDWVLKNGPVRQNDPVYLKEVQSFYAQIGAQLKGELWKDGGPVIGIQLENEYREGPAGSGRGSEHIRKLKEMAIADGLDVPLYTVTGWDGAAVPLDAVLPTFGGYPDAPWQGTNKPLYGNEIYAFRFRNRVAGNMGAVGGGGQNAAASYKNTPFLTAEVGGGGQDTYFRRPAFDADDIAAIAPVMLGSGVNLLGYYMFHGGVNPDSGSITLEESQRAGDATDVPEKSYDFQSPLGAFGQERESLRKMKLVHYFLNDFGAELAPMMTHAPTEVPSGPKDTSVARVAARTNGEAGFVFVNNYVRGVTMPERKGFQVELKLPKEVVKVPEEPIDLPAGAYGIWPVNLPLRGVATEKRATLRYSTAQLFKRVETGGQAYYFFFALPGVSAEFALDAGVKVTGVSGPLETSRSESGVTLRVRGAGTSEAEVRLDGGVRLVLLPEVEAEQVWRGDDPSMLLLTKSDAFSDGARWTLQSDDPTMKFGLCGEVKPGAEQKIARNGKDGVFVEYGAVLPKIELKATVTKVQEAKPREPWTLGPKLSWRPNALPIKPEVSEFAGAATWRIEVPPVPAGAEVSDVWLKIDYQGDEARLSEGKRLIDDDFWNGLSWTVGLKEALPDWRSAGRTLELRVLPLPKTYPMYLEKADALHFDAGEVADTLSRVNLIPQYQLVLNVADQR